MAAALVILTLAAACVSSRIVVAPGQSEPVPNAPVNEADRPGLVRYKSSTRLAARNRANAYEKMASVCAGKYRIVKEGAAPVAEGGLLDADDGGGVTEYTYISFACVRDSVPR